MSQHERAEIVGSEEPAGTPTIEQQYESLVEEGVIEGAAKPGEKPDWVPEKFWDAEKGEVRTEALAKSYAELERGRIPEDEDEGGGEEVQYAEATPEERKAAEEATQKAGLDLVEVSNEWRDNGGLTDETYEKLEAAGYPREAVDIYIEGLTSRVMTVQNSAYGIVGGQDAYSDMVEWAADALSDEEIAAYDEAVNSGDIAKVKMAVQGLNARWMAAASEGASEEPEEQITSKSAPGASSGYASFDEYMEAASDPRYDTNESYRNAVIAKLARSKF